MIALPVLGLALRRGHATTCSRSPPRGAARPDPRPRLTPRCVAGHCRIAQDVNGEGWSGPRAPVTARREPADRGARSSPPLPRAARSARAARTGSPMKHRGRASGTSTASADRPRRPDHPGMCDAGLRPRPAAATRGGRRRRGRARLGVDRGRRRASSAEFDRRFTVVGVVEFPDYSRRGGGDLARRRCPRPPASRLLGWLVDTPAPIDWAQVRHSTGRAARGRRAPCCSTRPGAMLRRTPSADPKLLGVGVRARPAWACWRSCCWPARPSRSAPGGASRDLALVAADGGSRAISPDRARRRRGARPASGR